MSWWEQLLKSLGFNPTQLRWRLHRLKERARRKQNQRANQRRVMTYQHKLCPRCGLNVDGQEKRCPRCETRLPSIAKTRLIRLWREVVPPGTYTYTRVFVAVNVAFFLVMWLQSGGGPSNLGQDITARVIYRFGAVTAPAVLDGRQWWRLVTPIFLHFDLLHIIFNCLWLVQLGPLMEQHFGRSRYLALYLGSGIAGFLLSVLMHADRPVTSAGASGVVFGLMGAAMVLGYVRRVPGSELLRAGLVKWVLLAVIISFLPQIDGSAHAGGGFMGALMGYAMAIEGQARRLSPRIWLIIEGLCLLIILLSLYSVWASMPTGAPA